MKRLTSKQLKKLGEVPEWDMETIRSEVPEWELDEVPKEKEMQKVGTNT